MTWTMAIIHVHHDHMLIKYCDFVHHTIIHYLHHPDHRTEASKLHRRCKMDHGHKETRRPGTPQTTPDEPLDCKVPVVQSEHIDRLEWPDTQ